MTHEGLNPETSRVLRGNHENSIRQWRKKTGKLEEMKKRERPVFA